MKITNLVAVILVSLGMMLNSAVVNAKIFKAEKAKVTHVAPAYHWVYQVPSGNRKVSQCLLGQGAPLAYTNGNSFVYIGHKKGKAPYCDSGTRVFIPNEAGLAWYSPAFKMAKAPASKKKPAMKSSKVLTAKVPKAPVAQVSMEQLTHVSSAFQWVNVGTRAECLLGQGAPLAESGKGELTYLGQRKGDKPFCDTGTRFSTSGVQFYQAVTG